ncbi:MAG: hypothetical protein K6G18_07885 [Treponema sp.]|nr:hypothetical protein [Treponema sp.]
MKDEEIKALMNKYTEAISFNTLEGIHSPEDSEKFKRYENMEMEDCVALKRKEAHKIAIEVLDLILTPELKVFVRNLCLDRLGYPDDPEFYRIVGDYPQVGDKISVESLAEKGITNWTPNDDELLLHENVFIDIEKIDGKDYYVIKSMNEASEGDADEKVECLRNSQMASEVKRLLARENKSLEQKAMNTLDRLEKDVPLIGGLHI